MTRTSVAPGSNQLTRRAIVGHAVAAGVGVLAAACGPVQQGGARPADEAPAGTVTFWHWGDQTYYQRYRTLADEFQKRYPRITV